MKTTWACIVLLIVFYLGACSPQKPVGARPTDNPNTPYDESVAPDEGQPAFPELGQYWIIDPDNSCRFDADVVREADRVLEKLRTDHIAEVAVICQTGIKGSSQSALSWATAWGNWTKLGDKEDRRGLIWLVRPDVRPEDHRVATENSDWLYQNTVIDYFPVLEDAADYANYDDFNGALERIVNGTNEVLRRVVVPTERP